MDWSFTPLTWFVILAFATFRLAWMLAREIGPLGIFERMRLRLGKQVGKEYSLSWSISELFNCPLCLGIWIGLIALIAVTIPGIILKAILLWLAISGLQVFMTLLIIKDE